MVAIVAGGAGEKSAPAAAARPQSQGPPHGGRQRSQRAARPGRSFPACATPLPALYRWALLPVLTLQHMQTCPAAGSPPARRVPRRHPRAALSSRAPPAACLPSPSAAAHPQPSSAGCGRGACTSRDRCAAPTASSRPSGSTLRSAPSGNTISFMPPAWCASTCAEQARRGAGSAEEAEAVGMWESAAAACAAMQESSGRRQAPAPPREPAR